MDGSTSRANPEEAPASPSSSPAEPPEALPGARKAILVADDQLNVRNILEFNLKRRGFDVQVVHDGPAALSAASAGAPDLILLDIMMPGLDGFQVLERLRSSPETAEIPVLIVSARGSETDILRALQLGARDYVVKPFNLEVLFEKIRRALESPGETADAVAEPFRPVVVVAVEALDGPSLVGLVRRSHALARAGAQGIVVDLSKAPPPDRALLLRLAKMREDLAKEGAALRLVGGDRLAAAVDALEMENPPPVHERLAAALAAKDPR